MGSASITYISLFNPTYGSSTTHPGVITSFSAGGGSASITFRTQTKNVTFAPSVTLDDLVVTNNGLGDLSFSIFQSGVLVESFLITDFEDGRTITGFNANAGPNGSIDFGGDGTTITQSSSGANTVGVIVTGDDIFTFNDNITVTYFFESYTVQGTTYSTTNGVFLNGNDGNNTLLGFDVNDANGLAYNDTLLGGAGDDQLIGGAGNDTYQFSAGFGNDFINESETVLIRSSLTGPLRLMTFV